MPREPDGEAYRRRLADLVDAALTELFGDVATQGGLDAGSGIALAAVGSHGRRDAGPASDLDLMLIHDGLTYTDAQIADIASALWYPIWDADIALDHSVRSLADCRSVASADLPAAVGLIDVRCVAGDEAVLHRARSAVLKDWRSAARRRLPELLTSTSGRAERQGELAYRTEPDLKECRGGIRDAIVLWALVATWLTDRPHGEVDRSLRDLLDARDALSRASGRPGNVLLRVYQDDVAAQLGLDGADDLLAHLAQCGRVISAGLDTTVRHARQALRRPSMSLRPRLVRGRLRPPRLRPVSDGVVEHDGELTLAAGVDVQRDPELPLRAAAAAARTGLPLSPVTLTSLADAPAPPSPWPAAARGQLLTLMRSGQAQIPIWEALDLAGVVATWIPEWGRVRNRPQRSPVHIYTVDRHLVQTVANACAAPDELPERDTLLWAALLHDIGKVPGTDDHSRTGAELAVDITARLGLAPAVAGRVVTLVRHHLLLSETATSEDCEDPEVIAAVAERLGGDPVTVRLLRQLTQADAQAAGPTVWTAWRGRLVDTLTSRVLRSLGG